MKKKLHILALAAGGILLLCLLAGAVGVMKKGLALSDLPEPGGVTSVVVNFSEENVSRVLTQREDIALAMRLTEFLRYVPGPVSGDDGWTVSITFFDSDGSQTVLAANNQGVLWKNRWRKLRNPNTFVQLARAWFLPEESELADEPEETEPALSKETIDWLIWFQSLSEEEQRAVGFFPEEVRALMGSGAAQGTVDETAPEQ